MALLDIFRQHARLRMLEEGLENVQRELKRSALDWDEIYEKVRHQMGRVAKRAAVIEKENGGSTAERVAVVSPSDILARRFSAVLRR